MYIGQPEAPPLISEGQPLVVNAQAIEHGGMEIMDMDRILQNIIAIRVTFPVTDSSLDTSPGHPD